MSDDALNDDFNEDRKPKASRWTFPRLEHPLNMRLDPLRDARVSRVFLNDGVIVGYTSLEREGIKPHTLSDEVVSEIVRALAEEFSWDIAGERVLHLRTMALVKGKMPEADVFADDVLSENDSYA